MPFLTTDAAATDTVCRRFRIPVNLLPSFMGALDILTQAYHWEQFGDLTPDEQSSLFQDLITSYSEGCMIGITFSYITASPPAGSLALDGSTYNNDDYPLLSANIDTQWDNGDGTFTLPESQGRTIIGTGTGAGLTARAMGDLVGEETHSLTDAENGTHQHGVNDPGSVTTLAGVTAIALADPGLPSLTDASGSGDPHENMQPSLALPMAVWYQ